MFTKKQLIALIILIIIGLFTTWIFFSSQHLKYGRNNPNTPNAFMTDVYGVKMSKLGKPKSILISPKIVSYTVDNKMNIDKPFVIIHNKNEPAWHIHALHGTTFNNLKKITLQDNVHIRQIHGQNSRNITLKTSKITLFPDRSFAITHKPVTVIQPGTIVHAIGLTADLNKGYVKLLSKAQGQYDSKLKKAK